jgi:hypothetical protein
LLVSIRGSCRDVPSQPFEALGQVQQIAAHIGELSPVREAPQLLGDVPVIFGCGSLFVAHPAVRAKISAPTDNTSFELYVPEGDGRSRLCRGA